MSNLIEPKEIELTSKIRKGEGGKFITKKYRLGYYPATVGFDMIGESVALLDIMARNKTMGSREELKKSLSTVRSDICKFIEVQLSNGNWQLLDNDTLVDCHVPDREMLGVLLLKSHDYNSDFFFSGKLLTIFQKSMNQAKAQASKIFTQLRDSLSQKAKPRSKS